MATLRRKFKPKELRRLERARTALADKYGNLGGIRLKVWFTFNGQSAVPRGKDQGEQTTIREHFEQRLKDRRSAKGSQDAHRARREAERRGAA